MCGICGFVGKTDNKEEVLRRMMDKIRHRGPDSEGTYGGCGYRLPETFHYRSG